MMIYLDHCGTTPIAQVVREAIHQLVDANCFGNPAARHHQAGRAAHEMVEIARDRIARALNAHRDNVFFTSGASEANNLLIWGFAERNRDRGCKILVGASEHKSVLEPCHLAASTFGAEVETVRINPVTGVLDLNHLESLLSTGNKKPTLVATMLCNNEIPARHPVEAIAKICQNFNAYLHCDAVQGIVREAVDFRGLGASSMVWTPHKIYGPKGVGVLILDDIRPLRIEPLYRGGEQEKGLRPGTLNTLGISLAAITLDHHTERRSDLVKHMRLCDELFIRNLTDADIGFELTVPVTTSCPGIVNFFIKGVDAPTLLEKADPVCLNRGASCTGAGGERLAHVPTAMGKPAEIAANVIRASFGFGANLEDVSTATTHLVGVIKELRKKSNLK